MSTREIKASRTNIHFFLDDVIAACHSFSIVSILTPVSAYYESNCDFDEWVSLFMSLNFGLV